MDKRIKILLIVLVVLSVLGGGYYAYIIMTGEETVTAVATQPAPETPAEEPAGQTPAAEPGTKPMEMPQESAMEATAEKAAPEAERMAGAEKKTKEKAEAGPEGPAPADKPAAEAKQKAGSEKGKEAVPAENAEKTEMAGKGAGPAPCAPVISAQIKDKKVEFGSPEEFLDKSGMSENDIKQFSEKNMKAATDKVAKLKKAKAPANELDCANKELEMAGRLAKLVEEKFPVKPVKEVYTYSSLDKRDPFMSPLQIPRVYPTVPRNAPPLERIPSEQIKVKGIIWNEKGFRALVTSPDGRGYTIKVGDTIGNKGGKVVRISEKRVYVEERIPDIFGDIEVRDIVLKLYKEKEAE